MKVSQIRADDAGYIVNHSMQSIAKIDGIGHDFLPFQNGRLVDHYSGVVEDALSSDTLNENNERATNFSKIIWELDDARRRTES